MFSGRLSTTYFRAASRKLAALCVLALLLALSACSGNRRSMFGGEITVEARIDADANGDSPVKLDLLVIDDKALLEKLLALSAQDWFKAREQFRRDYPDDAGYRSWSWEWIPGQPVAPQRIEFGMGARAGLLFVGYDTPGPHRQRFDPHQDLTIFLRRTDWSVEQTP